MGEISVSDDSGGEKKIRSGVIVLVFYIIYKIIVECKSVECF